MYILPNHWRTLCRLSTCATSSSVEAFFSWYDPVCVKACGVVVWSEAWYFCSVASVARCCVFAEAFGVVVCCMVCFFLSASVTLLLLQWMMHVAFPSFYEYTNKKSEAVLIQFVFIITTPAQTGEPPLSRVPHRHCGFTVRSTRFRQAHVPRRQVEQTQKKVLKEAIHKIQLYYQTSIQLTSVDGTSSLIQSA